MGLRDFWLSKLSIYFAYHRHPHNRLIHAFTEPLLIYCFILWMSLIDVRSTHPYLRSFYNVGWIYNVITTVFIYLPIDPLTAAIIFFGITGYCALSNTLIQLFGGYTCFLLGAGGLLFVLVTQLIIGHHFFEKRFAPRNYAPYNTLVLPQGVLLGPLFSNGWRPRLAQEIMDSANGYITSNYDPSRAFKVDISDRAKAASGRKLRARS
ncbi:hypothetical protein PROFUN_00652 [Planoprotostelium fungivorum]|uniref:Uncharacterized protein n=1 Tax=Planoprotostelium fungivorum TaxID=1890364 RepID=A0A2P6NU12_9EUKA|nr:hypothetical protein PROFUN_14637 [Planoprotostelium fungivorum]PRP87441.1 hypothetical protein PROFUN_00652 [Planoprotostelium fungivorum]